MTGFWIVWLAFWMFWCGCSFAKARPLHVLRLYFGPRWWSWKQWGSLPRVLLRSDGGEHVDYGKRKRA